MNFPPGRSLCLVLRLTVGDAAIAEPFGSPGSAVQAIARAQPRVCFFGHHHTRLDAEIAGVRCTGLNKVAMPGNLVALDVPARGRGFELLGEWP